MDHARHILNKYYSGTLRNPSLSKLCASATPAHQPGEKIWVFADGSKIVAIGKGELRSIHAIAPPAPPKPASKGERWDLLQELHGHLYAARGIKMSPIGRYEEIFSEATRERSIAVARAKAMQQDPNIESVEVVMTLVKEQIRLADPIARLDL